MEVVWVRSLVQVLSESTKNVCSKIGQTPLFNDLSSGFELQDLGYVDMD